jgi:hypothetical protein
VLAVDVASLQRAVGVPKGPVQLFWHPFSISGVHQCVASTHVQLGPLSVPYKLVAPRHVGRCCRTWPCQFDAQNMSQSHVPLFSSDSTESAAEQRGLTEVVVVVIVMVEEGTLVVVLVVVLVAVFVVVVKVVEVSGVVFNVVFEVVVRLVSVAVVRVVVVIVVDGGCVVGAVEAHTN